MSALSYSMRIVFTPILYLGTAALLGLIGAVLAPALFGVAAMAIAPVVTAFVIGSAIFMPLLFLHALLQTKSPAIKYSLLFLIALGGIVTPLFGALILGLALNPMMLAMAAGLIILAKVGFILGIVTICVVFSGMKMDMPVSNTSSASPGLRDDSKMTPDEAPVPVQTLQGATFFPRCSNDDSTVAPAVTPGANKIIK